MITRFTSKPQPTQPPFPLEPVGNNISPRQIRHHLNALGMRDAVEAYVAQADQDVKDWWEFSTVIERDNAILIEAAKQLGMDDAQLDQFFADASKL